MRQWGPDYDERHKKPDEEPPPEPEDEDEDK